MPEVNAVNNWCRKITNAARFSSCGPNHEWISYTPCCFVWTPDNTIASKEDIVRIQQDIATHVNKNKDQLCRACITHEKDKVRRSVRQIAHDVIPIDAPPGKLVSLEFVFDVRCNAACVMCGPAYSTLWQQELKIPVTVTEKSSKEHWTNLSKLIDWEPVRRVYFAGGEPLLTSTSNTILSSIPDISLVELKYQTNGSVMPSESTLEFWPKAKRMILDISLDGTHEQYDYIRWPLKWESVDANIHKLTQWLQTHVQDWEININYTVNPMNLLYLDYMDSWFKDMKSKYEFYKHLDYGPCMHHAWGIEGVSPELIARFHQTHGADHPGAAMLRNQLGNRDMRQQLKRKLIELDQIRKLDWQTTFSRSAMLFDN